MALVLGLLLLLGNPGTVSAKTSETKTVSVGKIKLKVVKGTWIKKKGKYYWKYADGKIRKKAWFLTNGKHIWYTLKDGSRICSAFQKIKGNYYYFKVNGKLYQPEEACFRKFDGNTYYFYRDGHIATGRTKIGKTYYYFSAKGVLQRNQQAVKVGSSYYNIDGSGAMTKISETRARCYQAAWQFINAHSGSSQSNAQRFRSCFFYLLAYMRYTPGYYSVSSDYRMIDRDEGVYELALSTFTSPNLRGNCHRFAACVGIMAKELGYSPTVITTTGDHSFVIINGGYYDNMYGGLFGASSRPAYSVYKAVTL